MDTNDLLKQDFVQGMMSRPTRVEAEVLANRVVDLISDMITETVEQRMDENRSDYDYKL